MNTKLILPLIIAIAMPLMAQDPTEDAQSRIFKIEKKALFAQYKKLAAERAELVCCTSSTNSVQRLEVVQNSMRVVRNEIMTLATRESLMQQPQRAAGK